MPLALVTIVSGGGGAAALRFGAPAIVGQDNYATGFRGFGDGAHALGKADGGWYGTSDGGKSWAKVLDGGRDIEGDVHAAVLSSDGRTMHNLGAVAVVADKLGSYYTFNATSAEYFSVSEDLPLAFAATSRPTPVVFRGLPQPATCGDPKQPGLFDCPFRTGGRGIVRLAGISHLPAPAAPAAPAAPPAPWPPPAALCHLYHHSRPAPLPALLTAHPLLTPPYRDRLRRPDEELHPGGPPEAVHVARGGHHRRRRRHGELPTPPYLHTCIPYPGHSRPHTPHTAPHTALPTPRRRWATHRSWATPRTRRARWTRPRQATRWWVCS